MGLLDLPLSVRRLIYDYAGLAGQTIDLNISNLLVYPYQQYPDSTHAVRLRCARPELNLIRNRDVTAPTGEEEYWELKSNERSTSEEQYRLLSTHRCSGCVDGRSLIFTCKEIAYEVVPFVYANNNFIVRQDAPHGLKRVNMMGPEAIQALKSLTMKLDLLEERVQVATHSADKLHLQPLHLYERSSRSNFDEYTAAIKHLSENMRTGRSIVNLIFRVACCRMLDDVLLCLFQLPRLMYCGLWTSFGLGTPALVRVNATLARRHLLISCQSSWNGITTALVRCLFVQCAFCTKISPLGLSYSRPIFKTTPSSVEPPSAQIEETRAALASVNRRFTSHSAEIRSSFRYLDLPAELRLQILSES